MRMNYPFLLVAHVATSSNKFILPSSTRERITDATLSFGSSILSVTPTLGKKKFVYHLLVSVQQNATFQKEHA